MNTTPVGPFISIIIVLLLLTVGAVTVFVSTRHKRLIQQPVIHEIYSTTTIDLGTTTRSQ